MSKKLNSLSRSVLMQWYREQSEQVQANVRRGLGLFPEPTLNLSKELVAQENKPLNQ